MKLYWILDELLTPIAVHSDTYARWMQEQTARGEMNLCLVERTEFPDGTLVSTVFLGLNHSVMGPPVLFETTISTATAWPGPTAAPITPTMRRAQAICGLGRMCTRSVEPRSRASS